MQLFWLFGPLLYGVCTLSETLTADEDANLILAAPTIDLKNRSGRTLLKKLHSGAAFLAGIKLGSYLNKKGHFLPLEGHGSLASANSFQLFGKTVSTALSLSYGDNRLPLPLNDPTLSDNQSTSDNIPVRHVIVTVLDNPTQQTIDKLKTIAKITENDALQRNESDSQAHHQLQQKIKSDKLKDFIEKHNEMVKDFNKISNKTRINNRF